jgi:hypothetical protein
MKVTHTFCDRCRAELMDKRFGLRVEIWEYPGAPKDPFGLFPVTRFLDLCESCYRQTLFTLGEIRGDND